MKVSISWLKDYVDIDMEVDLLAHKLTMAGLEVDAVYDRYDYLNTVLVARITSIDPHPKADKLKLCGVQAGKDEHTVVCGAPNISVGMQAPLAMPGTEFPDGTTVSQSTIRGQVSHGMLCSEVELGLGTDPSGVLVLDAQLAPGTPLNQALELSDAVLDIDLTPNRSDCLSLLGVAREVAAIQGTHIKRPDIELPPSAKQIDTFTSVTIEAPDHCPRYAARLVDGVTVDPSPFWLQDRLMSVGLRPINNLVDITNFILMETGQPLHAFDFDRLADNRIVVRLALEGEKFTTLDEKDRQLTSEMLMICDGQKPVAIGGVMGGMNSEIESDTTRVLIESAYFNPISIRKTSKKLGLNTDASHRFERGVDPQGCLYALDRAAQLMAELGQGRLIGGTIDAAYELPAAPVVELSVKATNRLLGTNLDCDQIGKLLEAIELEVAVKDQDTLAVQAPSFRVDISRPEDLMEEVARCSGYDDIPVSFPTIPATTPSAPKLLTQRQRIRSLLMGLGFAEIINYSFIHQASCERLNLPEDDNRCRQLAILNPLTEEQTVMRTSLIPGLLETMQRNVTRQSKSLKLFETGKTFISKGSDAQPEEIDMLVGLWTGNRSDGGWYAKSEACDFYDLKGALEGLLAGLGTAPARFTQLSDAQCSYTMPGATAQIHINDTAVGLIGEVHPRVANAYDLKQTAFIFEIDMMRLLDQIPETRRAQPLPKYPSTARDATLIVDQALEADAILAQVQQMNEGLVEKVWLFDVFAGRPIPEGRKSVSLRIVYRSPERTLEDDTVNTLHTQIIQSLVDQFKADLPA